MRQPCVGPRLAAPTHALDQFHTMQFILDLHEDFAQKAVEVQANASFQVGPLIKVGADVAVYILAAYFDDMRTSRVRYEIVNSTAFCGDPFSGALSQAAGWISSPPKLQLFSVDVDADGASDSVGAASGKATSSSVRDMELFMRVMNAVIGVAPFPC